MITLSVYYFQRKVSNKISVKFQICFALWSYFTQARSYGVMVSTLDSESSDPSSNLGRTWYFLFVMGQLAFSKHNFVWLLLGCRSTVYSRDSSVGRALDWRSKGPRFDPGSRHFATACLSFLSCFFFPDKKTNDLCYRLPLNLHETSSYQKVWGTTEIRTRDLLFTRQAL